MEAEQAMELVTSSSELAAICERLAQHPYVTVDTEFLRESTFWPQLCVVQMAGPDEAVIIDALAEGLDLSPLYALMQNERIAKVFHAARQDVEIFWNLAKTIPAPMFDTQVAAMVLGYGDSISYDQLVQRITGHAIDKSSRFTDWSRRPLSPAQLTYAVSDVTHLRQVYLKLNEDLEKRDRINWVSEEMKVLTSPSTYRQEPENAWKRLKARVKKPRELAVLIEVAAWREREAQSRDVPRSRVIKDDAITELAQQQPKTPEALSHMRGLPKGFERSKSGEAILGVIKTALARDLASIPPILRDKPLSNGASATVELLKVLLRLVSEQHGVAAKVVATVDDLQKIAVEDEPDVPALTGWRRAMFGEQALKLKRGELALAFDSGRIVAFERPKA
jgi:ribonuclease D